MTAITVPNDGGSDSKRDDGRSGIDNGSDEQESVSGTDNDLNISTLTDHEDSNESDEEEEDVQEKSGKGGVAAMVGDTASDSSEADREDINGSFGNEQYDEYSNYDNPMPLMYYSRMAGSIKRSSAPTTDEGLQGLRKSNTLAKPSTCSAIGKVILDPTNPDVIGAGGTSGSTSERRHGSRELLLSSDLWKQPLFVMAVGYQSSGNLSLVSLPNGNAIIPPEQLRVREGGHKNSDPPIVEVTFDATGTILAAIDAGGTCTVFELKYTLTLPEGRRNANEGAGRTASQAQSFLGGADSGMFSSFMSAITGVPTPSTSADSDRARDGSDTDIQPLFTATIVQVSRISYPRSFGTPTCLAIDPSYKKKTTKVMMVGFADGRLLLTKRGFFQRRNDSVIYQGQPKASDESQYRGIEAIAWRGSLVAWADACGIKLFDSDTIIRIAHIDRPTGARPALYPTVSSVRPTLYFETKSKLLVAWGDCLMTLTVQETTPSGTAGSVTAAPGSTGSNAVGGGPPRPSASTAATRKRTVQCTMAWELDCVACGVAPLDNHHIVVLGLVPPLDDDDDGIFPENDAQDDASAGRIDDGGNDVEVQIVSRASGSVVYSDSIPVLKNSIVGEGLVAESAASFRLLSTFALQRMEDSAEIELDYTREDLEVYDSLFPSMTDNNKKSFKDLHLRWDLSSIRFDDDAPTSSMQQDDDYEDDDSIDDDDDASAYSDDYTFAIRGLPSTDTKPHLERVIQPWMVIASSDDIITARMAAIDDAITYTLANKMPGVALRRALQHRRKIRKYKISELVDNFFEALLRQQNDGDSTDQETAEPSSSLSLRRVKLAVKSMPALFGGNAQLWEKWASQVATIPGGLFLMREYIPVRDPILPHRVYDKMLEAMLREIDNLNSAARGTNKAEKSNKLILEGEALFLTSLVAWGPIKVQRELIKLYKHARVLSDCTTTSDIQLKQCEISLQRRYMQTAASYLQCTLPRAMETSDNLQVSIGQPMSNDSNDSLCSEQFLLRMFVPRAPLLSLGGEIDEGLDNSHASQPTISNSRLALDAMARIRMMQDRYDLALKSLLAIGAFHSTNSLEDIEKEALASISNPAKQSNAGPSPVLIADSSYTYIIGLIEFNHLHQCLLEDDFILMTDSKIFMPIFALIRLIGLDLVGDFLIEHCVSPADEARTSLGSKNRMRAETLPMDQVADQLEKSPSLLHWYLHLVFTKKPEVYVKFPNTANPPRAVTELHRMHFDLYIEFAGDFKDSALALVGAESYNVATKTTPLLRFLKAALPLGGIRPIEARRTFESIRATAKADYEGDSRSEEVHDFALELAYVIEHYSDHTESEAKGVVELYLKGAESVVLAVAYAQRQKVHAPKLWDEISSFCISNDKLFGSLLEAAALFGADLSRLVTRIPPGMAIEGLRRRLAAAVADYRLKVEIHETATQSAMNDRVALLREITHRSRRGIRYDRSTLPKKIGFKYTSRMLEEKKESDITLDRQILPKTLRTKERRDRYKLAMKPPLR